jgi:hypothetical protein
VCSGRRDRFTPLCDIHAPLLLNLVPIGKCLRRVFDPFTIEMHSSRTGTGYDRRCCKFESSSAHCLLRGAHHARSLSMLLIPTILSRFGSSNRTGNWLVSSVYYWERTMAIYLINTPFQIACFIPSEPSPDFPHQSFITIVPNHARCRTRQIVTTSASDC